MGRKNRTEELVRRAYGDPNDDDDQQGWQPKSDGEDANRRGIAGEEVLAASKSDRNGKVGASSSNDDDEDNDGDDDDDAAASSIAGSLGSSNANNKSGKNGSDDDELEKVKRMLTEGKDMKAVRTWRIIVVACLVLMGIGITAGTFIFLKQHDETQYQAAYTVVKGNIDSTTKRRVQQMFGAFQQASDVMTASAIADKMEWPFFTLKNSPFEALARHARDQSGAELITLSPFLEERQRMEWNKYSADNFWWYDQSRAIVEQMRGTGEDLTGTYINATFGADLFDFNGPSPVLNDTVILPGQIRPIPHAAAWQTSPPPYFPGIINVNFNSFPWFIPMYPVLDVHREQLMTSVQDASAASSLARGPEAHLQFHQQFSSRPLTVNETHPHSYVLTPISERLRDKSSKLVGMLLSTVAWDRYLAGLLPSDSVNGILIELVNNCNQSYTYMLNGTKSDYLGTGNFQNLTFPDSRFVIDVLGRNDHTSTPDERFNVSGDGVNYCEYSMVVYSTQAFKDSISTNTAITFTLIVAAVSALVIITFLLYDWFVRRRNNKVVEAAVRSDQVLMSLFPSNVRSRLFEAQQNEEKEASAARGAAAKSRLRNFLNGTETPAEEPVADKAPTEVLGFEGKPIADLFPETTVLFADISGFTAWSSVREPAQVFTLLETLYKAFDETAAKRKVFKVETVGDCYVAVAGLPDPRKDHALVMARFASDCVKKMAELVKILEVSLGPDTGDLSLRVGLHSGPVTAGVLRGERSRFQLFGDTMNTASRMESTGERGRIQCSQETADLLITAGKERWLEPRQEQVHAKGKGSMQTYWLETSTSSGDASKDAAAVEQVIPSHPVSAIVERVTLDDLTAEKTQRLIDWNVEVLLRILKQIIAKRVAKQAYGSQQPLDEKKFLLDQKEAGKTVIDEVREIVNLPGYRSRSVIDEEDAESAVIPDQVVQQLRDYITNIAALYNANPFHNFEHASHVTMSVTKLLSRIVAPAEIEYDTSLAATGKALHDHTYGITSDPLTQFACVYSALIHDVDHTGVPNAQLVKEKAAIAEYYKNQSPAEQNSVDLAWSLLMHDDYVDLRRAIYGTESELKRFRQLVVNSVMATDIVDKDLKTLRNARWAKAFSDEASSKGDGGGGGCSGEETEKCRVNRKATIVIEHLIQASDVSHTMQHWHIYRKWNEKFFDECYRAYLQGRSDTDPSVGWYQGEMGFYDFYIIPLARKLKDCGVFGVSSDEYLNYAIRNRQEWEERGQQIVGEMVERIRNSCRVEL